MKYTILYSVHLFLAICICWQGMNEIYKYEKIDVLSAVFSLTIGFLLIVNVVYSIKKK